MRWNLSVPVFLAAAAVSALSAPASKSSLPWVEDDASRAFAEAKSKKLPIFVEAWAPW
jgi:lipopolysaccharide export LptBFGC system permease protein LptF